MWILLLPFFIIAAVVSVFLLLFAPFSKKAQTGTRYFAAASAVLWRLSGLRIEFRDRKSQFILDMLSEGKISTEEAEKLLDAVEPDSSASPADTNALGEIPKNLYIRVLPKEGAEDTDQVKVTVPLTLVKAGINFMNLLPKEARKDIESAMENLNAEERDALFTAIQEFEVDVETSENTVRIYTG